MDDSQRDVVLAVRKAAGAVLFSRDVAYGTRESVDAGALCVLGDCLLEFDATFALQPVVEADTDRE